MGRKKLLIKLAAFFDLDVGIKNQRKEELQDLLMRLKRKEVSLKEEMHNEKNPDSKEKLSQKIDVVHTQRKKGVKMLKSLRSEMDIN